MHALSQSMPLGAVRIIPADRIGAFELTADRARRTTKASSNGTDAALVDAHEQDDRTKLWSPIGTT
jgi:hypothetical protein